ncbi:MAG: YihY/virulence factor BrkB family protein [Chloroflexi bacterium]|nr:YihY/virulence factor BrkB family protein [Chloroflexota bacterium]
MTLANDTVFGAVTAIVLFEAGKHLFFWFTALAGQRSVVYGPIASFVLLLMWGYVAGMIFLYGAALTRAAGELRPPGSPSR